MTANSIPPAQSPRKGARKPAAGIPKGTHVHALLESAQSGP